MTPEDDGMFDSIATRTTVEKGMRNKQETIDTKQEDEMVSTSAPHLIVRTKASAKQQTDYSADWKARKYDNFRFGDG